MAQGHFEEDNLLIKFFNPDCLSPETEFSPIVNINLLGGITELSRPGFSIKTKLLG